MPVRVYQASASVEPFHFVPPLRSKSHTGPKTKRLPGTQLKFTLDWKLESWLAKSSSTRYQSMSRRTLTYAR